MRTHSALLSVVALIATLCMSVPTEAATIIGGLVGSDLTDIGGNGLEGAYSPPNLAGFNAEFFANEEPGFGGGEFAFNVFDDDLGGGNNKWCCGNGSSLPFIVGADFSTSFPGVLGIELTSFTLSSSNDSPLRDPRVFTIEGSNDTTTGSDGTWTTIYSRTNSAASDWTARNQVLRYSPADGDTFLSTDIFTAFRMNTTATGATTGAFHALAEIEFFGVLVPEPNTVALCLMGLGGLVMATWRRRRNR